MKKFAVTMMMSLALLTGCGQTTAPQQAASAGWGYIDPTGNITIPPQFEAAMPFSQDRAAVLKGGRWGFIDKKGTFVIPPTYNTAESFSEGRAAVQVGEKWGFIDL